MRQINWGPLVLSIMDVVGKAGLDKSAPLTIRVLLVLLSDCVFVKLKKNKKNTETAMLSMLDVLQHVFVILSASGGLHNLHYTHFRLNFLKGQWQIIFCGSKKDFLAKLQFTGTTN